MGKCELSARENESNIVTRSAHLSFIHTNSVGFLQRTQLVSTIRNSSLCRICCEKGMKHKQTLWQDVIS